MDCSRKRGYGQGRNRKPMARRVNGRALGQTGSRKTARMDAVTTYRSDAAELKRAVAAAIADEATIAASHRRVALDLDIVPHGAVVKRRQVTFRKLI